MPGRLRVVLPTMLPVANPLRAARFLTDWVRGLKGHRSVTRTILDNEGGRVEENPQDNP